MGHIQYSVLVLDFPAMPLSLYCISCMLLSIVDQEYLGRRKKTNPVFHS